MAHAAGLRYTTDQRPSIARRKAGSGFIYLRADGTRVTDAETLRRIRHLVVPPAWTDVWICTDPQGHLQATGRDAKGRKQYRYHDRWNEVRNENKYQRMLEFAAALPRIRRRYRRDIRDRTLTRRRVLATVVYLLEKTLIRVGNDEYARSNRSFGLTTLRERHVAVRGSTVRFRFRGKSGHEHDVEVSDRRIAAAIRRLEELPGQDLFQYIDDAGELQRIASEDVNEYLRQISGQEFTAKHFRTWAGTVLCVSALQALDGVGGEPAVKRNIVCAVAQVARRLGNTAAVCRRCYIHPEVLAAYGDGTLVREAAPAVEDSIRGLRSDEVAALGLLRRRLARAA